MVQLPFLRHNMYGAIERLHNHNKILVLVHDVESIRATADGTWDLYVLKLANAVIVHTPMMAQVLHDNGVFAHCISLEFFDYISDCSREPSVITNNPVVVFAGNLMRCDFLKKLHDLSPKYRMQMYLYGKETAFEFPDNVKYKGFFDNENISYVDGDWGLVWDGDDIVTCSGNLGEYLKYNSSFKFSLYLALSIPVIVWSQSAMAKYVREYHLGICVDSLNGIRSGIQNLSQEEIEHIKISIGIYSQKVKTGQMLTAAINKALSVIKSDESTL
ncbi:MAG: hypothetical protein K6E73_09025 [Bacteroidales bacterium]|nr:hypothetical protein [Bacteroidales bacterium]